MFSVVAFAKFLKPIATMMCEVDVKISDEHKAD